MNLQESQTSIVEQPKVVSEPDKYLYGNILLIARVAWIVLTLLILALNVIMIPRYYALLQANCKPGLQCFALLLTNFDQQLLHQFSLSLGFVAAYQVMLDAISVLVCCALGVLLFWRKSSDRMALFCAFMLVLFGGAGFTNILQNTLMPVSPFWFALIGILDLLGQSSFMIFFFLFPSGHFVPRWTRWIVPCIVIYWIYTIFIYNLSRQFAWSDIVFIASLFSLVGSQVYRYRRVSTSRERQQTKWVVFGFSIGVVGFLIVIVTGNFFLPSSLHQSNVIGTLVAGTLTYGFVLLIPISIAIAILRSRLYDIDVIINKTLVYGSLTVLLAAAYLSLVLGLQALLGGLLHQTNTIALVVSTIVIYALFLPLRRRIQRLIDKRFYRSKYDAARTLETFSTTLRNEVDLASLRENLIEVVQETMQPSHVSLWLRSPNHQQNTWSVNPSVPLKSDVRDKK